MNSGFPTTEFRFSGRCPDTVRTSNLEQEAHHALVDFEVEVAVLREEISTRLDEERGGFGQRENGVTHFGEKLLDTLVGGGFPGARTAGEHDFGNHKGNQLKSAAKVHFLRIRT